MENISLEQLVQLFVNNGIGVICVAYLIYFQNTTMNKMLDAVNSVDKRLAIIESKVVSDGTNDN